MHKICSVLDCIDWIGLKGELYARCMAKHVLWREKVVFFMPEPAKFVFHASNICILMPEPANFLFLIL